MPRRFAWLVGGGVALAVLVMTGGILISVAPHLGRFRDAITDFDRTLLENPHNFLACYYKGRSHQDLKEFSEALDAFGAVKKAMGL